MRKLKLVCIVLGGVFSAFALLSTIGTAIEGRQFVYELSLRVGRMNWIKDNLIYILCALGIAAVGIFASWADEHAQADEVKIEYTDKFCGKTWNIN